MLIRKLIKSIALIIILILSLVGCSSSANSSESPKIVESEVYSTMNTTNEIFVKKFNLGASNFEERGKIIPYEKEGIIAIPKDINNNAPLVFIFHGRHSDKEKTDFEDGFKYLAEDLAKNGIIAVSIDNSINYSFKYGETIENERLISIYEDHLNSLTLANKGEDVGYGIDLKDKIDFQNIGLIGHSVAGSGVFDIASNVITTSNSNIKGILSITPAYNAIIDNFPDIESSIIVSEYDGDVIHAGADMYEDILEKNPKRNKQLTLTYLIGGNHNFFNSLLDDKEFSIPPTTNGSYPDKISKNEQMNFLSNYAVDYMKSIFKLDNTLNPIFNKNTVTPSKMYGYQVMNKIYYNSIHNIFDNKDFANVVLGNATSEEVVESYIPNKDNIGVFRTIENVEELNLLKIDWINNNSYIEIPLSNKNLSNCSQLGLSWALNSPSELNSKDKKVVFDIALVDSDNVESRLTISNNEISALKYIDGEIVINEYVEGMYHNYWSRPTPISDTIFPLTMFNNVNLSNIKSLKIYFNNTNSGSLVIDRLFTIN